MNGAQALAAGLRDAGVEVCFGLPGVHNLPLWDAVPAAGVRLAGVRHEQAAAYASDGFPATAAHDLAALVPLAARPTASGMPRHRGPVGKLERREGVDLGLKGERAAAGKGALERRPYPPGEHGRTPGRRLRRLSDYAEQLRMKQRAKRYYGLRERQFRRVFDRAQRGTGVVGDELLKLLERRLDNVLARLGFASTRRQARQFISHGHVTVNGRRVDVPSYEVSPGDVVAIVGHGTVEELARRATDLTAGVPPWLLADHDSLTARVVRAPQRDEINVPVEPQPIVELYSR